MNVDLQKLNDTAEVERHWNDPGYSSKEMNRPPTAQSNTGSSMRSSNQQSREFRISSSSRNRNISQSKNNTKERRQSKAKPKVNETRLEAFTPKLEGNLMRDGEILKNYGEFGESDTNFLKHDDDNLLDYFDGYDQSQDNEEYDQDDDISRNQRYGFRKTESTQRSEQSRKNEQRIQRNQEDPNNSNFNERNNRIIDRFDHFFDRMGIKEKAGGIQGNQTNPSYQTSSSLNSKKSLPKTSNPTHGYRGNDDYG